MCEKPRERVFFRESCLRPATNANNPKKDTFVRNEIVLNYHQEKLNRKTKQAKTKQNKNEILFYT